MNIKKTALYELHKKHNAKFVEFAGYSMPIQYSEGIVKGIILQEINLEYSMFPIWGSYSLNTVTT